MKKIISLFQRNYDGDRLVRDEVVPGAEWVTTGEGVATRKWDGTCCMVRDGRLYKRYDAKQGRTTAAKLEPAQDFDETTGHMPGWVPVSDWRSEDQWFREAFSTVEDGTYELIGPKIQGNPEGAPRHVLKRHGVDLLPDAPRSFHALREWLSTANVEGIVWHHPDGRMVKIKAKDFGIKR